MRRLRSLFVAILLAVPVAAGARDYCPERPGLDTAPCIVDQGRVSVEASGIDWERDTDAVEREDRVLFGDVLVRYGIAPHTEIRAAWTPYGHVATRDRVSGATDRADGTGDAAVGFKRNLIDPDGEHVSVALLPSVRLPVGGKAIGDGTWSASLLVPVSVALSDSLDLVLTPEVDAAADDDRHGRHTAYGSAGGFQYSATDALDLSLEALVLRDDDPGGRVTKALASVAAGVMIGPDLQIDAGGAVALNRRSPDNRLYVGLSRRF